MEGEGEGAAPRRLSTINVPCLLPSLHARQVCMSPDLATNPHTPHPPPPCPLQRSPCSLRPP